MVSFPAKFAARRTGFSSEFGCAAAVLMFESVVLNLQGGCLIHGETGPDRRAHTRPGYLSGSIQSLFFLRKKPDAHEFSAPTPSRRTHEVSFDGRAFG